MGRWCVCGMSPAIVDSDDAGEQLGCIDASSGDCPGVCCHTLKVWSSGAVLTLCKIPSPRRALPSETTSRLTHPAWWSIGAVGPFKLRAVACCRDPLWGGLLLESVEAHAAE